MEELYIQDKTYEKVDFTASPLPKGEYEKCSFLNCNCSEADFSETKFIDCTFSGCNLSLVKFNKTILRDVVFTGCKMIGIQFDVCEKFGLSFSFEWCQLSHTSFYKLQIPKTVFRDCLLFEADFREAILTLVTFEKCDLERAVFNGTNLQKADFRNAYNYSFDPSLNNVKKARFSASGLAGLLDTFQIIVEDDLRKGKYD